MKERTILKRCLFVNSFSVIIKMFIGIKYNSNLLIISAIQSLSDLFTDIASLIAIRFSLKRANYNYPYGYGKIEYIASLFIGSAIVFGSINIIVSSFKGGAEVSSYLLIYVSLFVMIIKLLLALYLKDEALKSNNSIVLSSYKEALSDSLGSLLIVFSFLLLKFNIFKGISLLTGFLIGIYILKEAISLIIINIKMLLDKREDKLDLEIKEDILLFREVLNVKNICLIRYGSYYKGEIDLTLKEDLSLEKIIELISNIKAFLKEKYYINYLSINIIKEVNLCQNYLK